MLTGKSPVKVAEKSLEKSRSKTTIEVTIPKSEMLKKPDWNEMVKKTTSDGSDTQIIFPLK